MPPAAPSSRPLLYSVLALIAVALFALLFTAIVIDRATPEELAIMFPRLLTPAPATP